MRNLGASRTSAFFGAAPFAGALLSFMLFRELPNTLFYISLPIMIIGAVLLLSEEHGHVHLHGQIEHEHRHSHDDGHHTHENENISEHSHVHTHEAIKHSHSHTPDTHHRHAH